MPCERRLAALARLIQQAPVGESFAPAVITRLVDDTGADATTIAAAYAATRDSFDLTGLYHGIDALDIVTDATNDQGQPQHTGTWNLNDLSKHYTIARLRTAIIA